MEYIFNQIQFWITNTRYEDKIGKRFAVGHYRFKPVDQREWDISVGKPSYYEREDDGTWFYLYAGTHYICREERRLFLEELYSDDKNGIDVFYKEYKSEAFI